MNRNCFLLIAVAIFSLHAAVNAQKIVLHPPAENASMSEVQKWIVNALPKYASYKTRSGAFAVSEVTFDACTLRFVSSKRVGTTTTITEGAKRTVSSSKETVTVDVGALRAESISLNDHLYPDLQTLEIKRSANDVPIGIVVKRAAAEAVKAALAAAGRHCSPKTGL